MRLTNSPLSRDTLKFSLLCVESANLFQKLGGNLARNALEGNSFPPPPETETVPVSGRDMVVDIGSRWVLVYVIGMGVLLYRVILIKERKRITRRDVILTLVRVPCVLTGMLCQ
jgi:hypothetical protein